MKYPGNKEGETILVLSLGDRRERIIRVQDASDVLNSASFVQAVRGWV